MVCTSASAEKRARTITLSWSNFTSCIKHVKTSTLLLSLLRHPFAMRIVFLLQLIEVSQDLMFVKRCEARYFSSPTEQFSEDGNAGRRPFLQRSSIARHRAAAPFGPIQFANDSADLPHSKRQSWCGVRGVEAPALNNRRCADSRGHSFLT